MGCAQPFLMANRVNLFYSKYNSRIWQPSTSCTQRVFPCNGGPAMKVSTPAGVNRYPTNFWRTTLLLIQRYMGSSSNSRWPKYFHINSCPLTNKHFSITRWIYSRNVKILAISMLLGTLFSFPLTHTIRQVKRFKWNQLEWIAWVFERYFAVFAWLTGPYY